MTITTHPVPRLDDGREPRVTSGFGPRTGGMFSTHYGVDILFPRADEPAKMPWSDGTWAVPDAQIGLAVPALAAGNGVVTKSSWTGTGDRIRIDHGGGLSTGYMHLRNRLVSVGDRVVAGQPIATISFSPWKRGGPVATPGNPAKIGLNHLHFEVYRNGTQVDPEQMFGRHLKNLSIVAIPGLPIWLKLLLAGALGYAAYKYLGK